MNTMSAPLALFFSAFVIGLSFSPAFAYSNNPIQGVHQDIQSEMETEEKMLFSPAQILWQHTLQRNTTLQLALQKLAEKTGKIDPKDKAKWTSRMLQSIIQVGGMGSAVATGSPAPLLGSAVLGRITTTPEAATRLTEVSSADLVILSREIEKAQCDLILTYMRYRQAQEYEAALQASLDDLHQRSQTVVQDSTFSTDIINNFLADHALQLQQAHTMTETYRNLLVLSAGEDALKEVEAWLRQHPSSVNQAKNNEKS